MSTIINFIQDKEVIIMASLLVLIVILTIAVLITDFINKKKNIKDANELFISDANMVDAFKEEIHEINPLEYTTDLGQYEGVLNLNIPQNNEKITEIKYVEEDEELEKTKAKIELETLKEELIKADIEEKRKKEEEKEIIDIEVEKVKPIEVEEIIDLSDNLETSFEDEQEENAIISLDEFNKVSDKIYEQNDTIQYMDEGNEPISIKELEELYSTKELKDLSSEIKPKNIEKVDTEVIETIDIEAPAESKNEINQKFKSSPIISPVYGIDNNTEENIESIMLENTANLDKLSQEIKKTNEFLNTLRELKKNLQ